VAALNAFVQEHISGMQVVQAFAAEEKEMEKFSKINQQHKQANIKAIFAYSVFFPVVEVVLALSIGLIVWWVAGQSLDAGMLVAFILFLNQIFRPLRMIADKFNVLQMGMVAAERVFKVLDNKDITINDGKYAPEHIRGEIEFKKLVTISSSLIELAFLFNKIASSVRLFSKDPEEPIVYSKIYFNLLTILIS
jgi:ATP-binding cassette subfamily B protein